MVRMVTPDLDSADDYRNVLLGIVRALTFTDPAGTTADDKAAQEPEAPAGAAAAIRNDFGQRQLGWTDCRRTSAGQHARCPRGGPMILIGIFGLLATLSTIPLAVLLTRTCRKTLAQYSFDTFCPQITKVDGAKATKGRPKSMTLTLHTAEGHESPQMRINPAPLRGPWRNPWPQGIENGLYIAGDLPFGAVGYVPSSGAFLFVQPAEWDATAHDRKQATPDRVARARAGGLARKII